MPVAQKEGLLFIEVLGKIIYRILDARGTVTLDEIFYTYIREHKLDNPVFTFNEQRLLRRRIYTTIKKYRDKAWTRWMAYVSTPSYERERLRVAYYEKEFPITMPLYILLRDQFNISGDILNDSWVEFRVFNGFVERLKGRNDPFLISIDRASGEYILPTFWDFAQYKLQNLGRQVKGMRRQIFEFERGRVPIPELQKATMEVLEDKSEDFLSLQ